MGVCNTSQLSVTSKQSILTCLPPPVPADPVFLHFSCYSSMFPPPPRCQGRLNSSRSLCNTRATQSERHNGKNWVWSKVFSQAVASSASPARFDQLCKQCLGSLRFGSDYHYFLSFIVFPLSFLSFVGFMFFFYCRLLYRVGVSMWGASLGSVHPCFVMCYFGSLAIIII